jgi:hypothetical protein
MGSGIETAGCDIGSVSSLRSIGGGGGGGSKGGGGVCGPSAVCGSEGERGGYAEEEMVRAEGPGEDGR